MKIFFHRKPYLTTLMAIGALTAFQFLFFVRTAFGQQLIILADDSFDATLKVIQLASVLITFLGFAAGFVWYIVKGKSSEQQATTIKQLETSNSDLRGTNNDLRLELSQLKAELRQIEIENENLRKANLRLQGIHDTEK